jgi:hypothetical protein
MDETGGVASPAQVELSPRIAWPWLAIVTALVSIAGLTVEVLARVLHLATDEGVVPYLSLSNEGNVPTYWSAALLAASSVLLAIAARAARLAGARFAWAWWLLAGGFAFMSLDEAIEIHEHMTFFHTHGALYFSWVIPAAIVVLAVGVGLIGFLRSLPPSTRWRFVIAGAMYVLGAVGFELPLGMWTERFGDQSLGYALIDWGEETLEMAGVVLFIHAILRHLWAVKATVSFGGAEAKRPSDR